jgi:hypothetical protein
MELWAETNCRPKELTKQYLFFISYRDGLSLSSINSAYHNLVKRGLLQEHDFLVKLGKNVPREYWHLKDGKWKASDSSDEADLIMFDSRMQHDEKLGKVIGFVDTIVSRPIQAIVLYKSLPSTRTPRLKLVKKRKTLH